MIPPISMLKIQELPGAMLLDPHRGSAPRTRGPHSAAIEGFPPPPPATAPSGSGPDQSIRPIMFLCECNN